MKRVQVSKRTLSVLYVVMVACLVLLVLWSYEMHADRRPVLFLVNLLLAVAAAALTFSYYFRRAWVRRQVTGFKAALAEGPPLIWRWHHLPYFGAALNLAIWQLDAARAAPPPWFNTGTFFLLGLFFLGSFCLLFWDFMRRAMDQGVLQALMLKPVERVIFALGAVAMLATEALTNGRLMVMVLAGAAGAVYLALPRRKASGDGEGHTK